MSTTPIERIPPTYASQSTADPSAGEQAKDKAQEAAGQAKEKAGAQLRAQVDQRSTEAGEPRQRHRLRRAQRATSCASRARTSRRSSPSRRPTAPSGSAATCATATRDRILGDVEDFGRRQPWAVIAGGVAVGFAASRFLKASSTRRYDQRSQPRPPLPHADDRRHRAGHARRRRGPRPADHRHRSATR